MACNIKPLVPMAPSQAFSDCPEPEVPLRPRANDPTPNSIDRICKVIQGHFHVHGEQVVGALAFELERLESFWEAQVRALQAENDLLRAEPCWDSEKSLVVKSERPEGAAFPPMGMQWTSTCAPQWNSTGTGFCPDMLTGPSVQKVNSLFEGLVGLAEKFNELDVQGTGVVKVEALKEKLVRVADKTDAQCLENFSSLLEALRTAKPLLFQGLEDDEMSYDVLKELLQGQGLASLGRKHVNTLNALRSTCVHDDTMLVVSRTTAVCREDLGQTSNCLECADKLWWLELIMACVIVINAASIGLSEDIEPNSKLWQVGELICTAFFVFELVCKLVVRGPVQHFLGADWKWSLFDFLLVIFAVVDLTLSFYVAYKRSAHSTSTLRDLTVLRIMRLMRIVRLARLLRVKYMKELTLMAIGVSGLRTLCWAVVLLFGLVYAMGVFTHQIMADWNQRTPCDDSGVSCTAYERTLYENHGPLFGDLFKTCFTVFRCVTSDCNIASGAPLAPLLLETQGKFLILGYVCCTLFVVIGVFNLIMAVFVENTLEGAKQDQQKQRYLRQKEQVQLAQNLQRLVDKIVSYARMPTKSQQMDGLLKYLPSKGFLAISDPENKELEVAVPTPFKITREIFDEAMADLETKKMLDNLEVSISNFAKFFDILDSDGNGVLDVHEIVDGIMRLRGPADKSDIVSAGLMIRSLQRNVTDIKTAIEQLQKSPFSLATWSRLSCATSETRLSGTASDSRPSCATLEPRPSHNDQVGFCRDGDARDRSRFKTAL